MSIFPGNVLVIDDQFNLGYQKNEPEDISQKTQWGNFRRLQHLFDNNGFCFATITETNNIVNIIDTLKKYQNIRLLILDLDLDESGEVEEGDIEMVKYIVLASLDIFGYYFLAINSSYSEKWDTIRDEMLADFELDTEKNKRTIHFLKNFCISLNKSNQEIEDQLLALLSGKFSTELITQFEAKLNYARDRALSPFMDFASDTWEHLYKILKEDMDSREHVNFTLNSFLFGLLKQHMIDINYTVPNAAQEIDSDLQQSMIRSFSYLDNINKQLDKHPVWTGNLYYNASGSEKDKYLLVITPECDIAQSKGIGYTVITGFEYDLPIDYEPKKFEDNENPPLTVKIAGKKDGKWKSKSDIGGLIKGPGFYPLLHGSRDKKHLIFDMRSAFRIEEFPSDKYTLQLRVNEPIITDITDKFSAIFNRKGVPRLTSKKYF